MSEEPNNIIRPPRTYFGPPEFRAVEDYLRDQQHAFAGRVQAALSDVIKEVSKNHADSERRNVALENRLQKIVDSITGGVDIDEMGYKGAIHDLCQRTEKLEESDKKRDEAVKLGEARRWQVIIGIVVVSVGAFVTATIGILRSFFGKWQ